MKCNKKVNVTFCKVARLAFFKQNFRNLAFFKLVGLKNFTWLFAFLSCKAFSIENI